MTELNKESRPKFDKSKFEFNINKEFIDYILKYTLQAELTDEQWEDLQDKIGEYADEASVKAIKQILEYAAIMERSKVAEQQKPHYVLKVKEPYFSPEFYVYGYYQTEADAKNVVEYNDRYFYTGGVEWVVEKVE